MFLKRYLREEQETRRGKEKDGADRIAPYLFPVPTPMIVVEGVMPRCDEERELAMVIDVDLRTVVRVVSGPHFHGRLFRLMNN